MRNLAWRHCRPDLTECRQWNFLSWIAVEFARQNPGRHLPDRRFERSLAMLLWAALAFNITCLFDSAGWTNARLEWYDFVGEQVGKIDERPSVRSELMFQYCQFHIHQRLRDVPIGKSSRLSLCSGCKLIKTSSTLSFFILPSDAMSCVARKPILLPRRLQRVLRPNEIMKSCSG